MLVFSIGFLLFLNSIAVLSFSQDSSEPVVGIEPREITVAPGETFTVNITISDVTLENSVNGIYGWQFALHFNSSVIQVASVNEGPFLMSAGSTWWTAPSINNATGVVVATDLLFPYPDFGAFGSGTLANVTFRVMAQGKTALQFLYEPPPSGRGETKLRTYVPPPTDQIQVVAHTAVDGAFEYPLFRDVVISDVAVSPDEIVAGNVVSINVTVRNDGKATESFDVTVAYDSSTVDTQHVTDLAPDGSQVLSFSWDTDDVAEGNYTITATASTVSGEADTANNVYVDGEVRVLAPPPFLQWELIAAGLAVAVVVVVVAWFLYSRRRKSR